jgi:acetyltransferase-like isoleucine patch superfamily enzyme
MNDSRFPLSRVHPTALIEEGVELGEGTAVWDNVHIRRNAKIGRSCILGEKTYVAYDVSIGNYCKLNANVYVCAGVTISDYVMLSAHVVFTNDRFPRAFHKVLDGLASSEPNEETLSTVISKGVTVGAGAVIGPGLNIGEFAMVGMGSVVTHHVPSNGLVVGNPARLVGYVCACGPLLIRYVQWEKDGREAAYTCKTCRRKYQKTDVGIREIAGPEPE